MDIPPPGVTYPIPRRRYRSTSQRRVKRPRSNGRTLSARPADKKKRPRARARGRPKDLRRPLLAGVAELARHARERVLLLAAKGIHGRDDRDGDAGRDEAVFDGGRAALVLQETLEHRH